MLMLKSRTKNNKIENEWDEAYSGKDFPDLKMHVTVMIKRILESHYFDKNSGH